MATIDDSLLTDESDGQEEIRTIKRINQQMILQNIGVEVSIVGKYVRTYDNKTSFLASDNRYFMVKYAQNVMVPQYTTNFVEIRGIPDKNGVIMYGSHTAYGNDLNMQLWNKFVKLTQKYPSLFWKMH